MENRTIEEKMGFRHVMPFESPEGVLNYLEKFFSKFSLRRIGEEKRIMESDGRIHSGKIRSVGYYLLENNQGDLITTGYQNASNVGLLTEDTLTKWSSKPCRRIATLFDFLRGRKQDMAKTFNTNIPKNFSEEDFYKQGLSRVVSIDHERSKIFEIGPDYLSAGFCTAIAARKPYGPTHYGFMEGLDSKRIEKLFKKIHGEEIK